MAIVVCASVTRRDPPEERDAPPSLSRELAYLAAHTGFTVTFASGTEPLRGPLPPVRDRLPDVPRPPAAGRRAVHRAPARGPSEPFSRRS